MKQGKDYIGVGVGAVIINNNKILLLLRKKAPEAGFWSIPGGKVEMFDTIEDTIIREVKEEINVEVEIVRLLGVTNHIIPRENSHWVSPNFLVTIKSGEIRNLEPEKHEELRWFDIDSLPENITITTRKAVKDYKTQLHHIV